MFDRLLSRPLAVAVVGAALALAAAPPASAGETPSPPGARVYFVNLKDGDTVQNPVRIVFGLSGMGVAPAGVEMKNTGHHHLLIDVALKPEDLAFALPADDNHRHFGGGQTEIEIVLPPGRRTLQLVLGDHMHVPHNPPVMSPRIAVTVK